MYNNKNKIFIIIVLLLNCIISSGYAQSTTKVIRKDNYSYEVFCKITFSNNVADKLWKFCWDMNNIKRILADEPATISFSEVNLVQTIAYDYQFIFMRYYSEYERKQRLDDKIISFRLTKSKSSIPFIPNLKNGYGIYTIKLDNKITTMQYYQYSETDGVMRDFYFNYFKKDIERFFNSFESEFNEALKNDNN